MNILPKNVTNANQTGYLFYQNSDIMVRTQALFYYLFQIFCTVEKHFAFSFLMNNLLANINKDYSLWIDQRQSQPYRQPQYLQVRVYLSFTFLNLFAFEIASSHTHLGKLKKKVSPLVFRPLRWGEVIKAGPLRKNLKLCKKVRGWGVKALGVGPLVEELLLSLL